MGWELRWGGEGEEKVKGSARKDDSEGEDSVHEAVHTPQTPGSNFPLTNESVHLV